ncbi:MAG: phage head closure protein [Alistipes sp.]|nr:phage head closure protein [Alistipes sp.]
MFNHRIEIHEYREVRDAYNDRTKELRHVAVCYAQRTEAGGRENLYAGRIVHENEVVYTIRYRAGLLAGMVVKDGVSLRKITSIHEEGRRWLLHLKTTKSDADN